jgi:hypothetical protein
VSHEIYESNEDSHVIVLQTSFDFLARLPFTRHWLAITRNNYLGERFFIFSEPRREIFSRMVLRGEIRGPVQEVNTGCWSTRVVSVEIPISGSLGGPRGFYCSEIKAK